MAAEMRWFVDIEATPQRVWQVLTDVSAYPQWNPFITSTEGTSGAGGRVSVSLPPLNALVRPTCVPRCWRWSPLGGCGSGCGWPGWAFAASSTPSTR